MDSNKRTLAYFYGQADPRDAQVGKALTLDDARRIASNIAKLPDLPRQSRLTVERRRHTPGYEPDLLSRMTCCVETKVH